MTSSKNFWLIFIWLQLTIGLVFSKSADCKELADNNSDKIKLLVTTNLQGWFNSKTIYPRRSAFGLSYFTEKIAQKKKKFPTSILIDSGDFFYGSTRSFYAFKNNKYLAENVFMQSFLALDYDFITLGNRDLENLEDLLIILKSKKLNLSAVNLISPVIEPYRIFYTQNKKILVVGIAFPATNSLENSSWKLQDLKKSLTKIKKITKQEKIDIKIGVFHLSLFYSDFNIPSINQVIELFPDWDLVIAGNSLKHYPITYVGNVPIISVPSKGAGWSEIDLLLTDNKIEKITTKTHLTKNSISKDVLDINFENYLNQNSGWKLKNKNNIRKCLEFSLADAVKGENLNYSLLPKLKLKPLYLKKNETIKKKHLFYWLPHFNKRAVLLFSAYDFKKVTEGSFEKKYFFTARQAFSKNVGFFEKYTKKYQTLVSDYDARKNSFLTRNLLLKPVKTVVDDSYLQQLWFDYLANNPPSEKNCTSFVK